MRPVRRELALGLVLLLAGAAGWAQEGQAPAAQAAPCVAEEHRQFDFWVGSWRVESPDGAPLGRNVIRTVLNGCALEESWRGADGSIGKSLNMYYARDGRWHQSWVDGSGGRLDLAGGLDGDGRMVMTGTTPGRDGGRVEHEISWQALPDGAVRQHWRRSTDSGTSWQEVFVGIYRPSADGATPADGRD